jgi:hypothetical protein
LAAIEQILVLMRRPWFGYRRVVAQFRGRAFRLVKRWFDAY